VRVGPAHPIDLFQLAGGEFFLRVQAPPTLQKALASKHFVQARDAAAKVVGSVKQGRVGIGDFCRAGKQL
jgi:hypothetical protein